MKGQLFTVSGPAGVGKGTLVAMALEKDPSLFLSVSCTTREVRAGETEGVTYHYIGNEKFDQMIEDNAFYEWAEVHGNRYGTPCEPVERALEAGRSAILEIDVQGSAQVYRRRPDTIRIFVLPPDWAALRHRLISRARDPLADVKKRIRNALNELRAGLESDYVIVNEDRESAVRDMLRVIHGENAEEFAIAGQKDRILHLIETYEEVN